MSDAEARLAAFLAAYDPQIAAGAREIIDRLRVRLPGARLLVYDNYNALAVGFGATEKTGAIALSVAVYPRWVSLFLMGGPQLDDPHRLLKGGGTTTRHVVLDSADRVDDQRVVALIEQAVARCEPPIPPDGGYVVIKSVSAKQRPRRPNPSSMG